ncbi:hypothetical protein PIB30_039149 [Stylosanthes scabra]|uniref:Uncharacterized protein n=1 Tax=Stylosanthes scabra TaxID=79078 RepID=A0ABU6UCW3_9FABA|nr:hypothetical protein [Stylosanthes scabra]
MSGFCGFLHKMLWKAKPKSIEKFDPSATKYFCGAVHEISPLEKHVSYSDILPANPLESGLTPSALPTHCDICDLKNEDDFRRKDQDLRDQWKKYNASISLCKWEKPKEPEPPVLFGRPILGGGDKDETQECVCKPLSSEWPPSYQPGVPKYKPEFLRSSPKHKPELSE